MIGFIILIAICFLVAVGYFFFRTTGAVKEAPEHETQHVSSHVPSNRRPHPHGPSPIPGAPSDKEPGPIR